MRRPFCLMASRACWMCTRNCLGVPCKHTGTCNSTLWGRVSFKVLVLVILCRYVWNGQFTVPAFLSCSWGMSLSGTAFTHSLHGCSKMCTDEESLEEALAHTVHGHCCIMPMHEVPQGTWQSLCQLMEWSSGAMLATVWGGHANWLSIVIDLCSLLVKKY